MIRESIRRCSYCGKNGHNSRTCNEKNAVKLFGVKILGKKRDDSMKKSLSLGNLRSSVGEQTTKDHGYLSDGLIQSQKTSQRKKGMPWTEEEHRTFLDGLQQLGKGDWRGISKNFVTTRTPTQVASHAQKYFLRKAGLRRKCRSSVFDMDTRKPIPLRQIAPAALPMKRIIQVPKQQVGISTNQAKASSSFRAPPLIPVVPTYQGIPYMMAGFPGGRLSSYPDSKIYQALSFMPVPVVNFTNQGYAYLPKPHNNSFATCAPPQSVSSTSAQSVACGSSHPELGTSSSTVNTDLELGTATPQAHNGAKLPSQTPSIGSGAIRVV